MADDNHEGEGEQPSVRVTDKRRLDPDSGAVREGAGSTPAPGPAAPADGPVDEIPAAADPVAAELTERTEDLRRLKAEYDNYRRRIDREKASWGEAAVAKLAGDLLPALDDIDRARAHGELEGAFRAVADVLEKVVTAAGLTRFGAAGEPFDPSRHEALTSMPVPTATVESVLEVYRAGYEFKERILRAAQVVVAVPAGDPDPA